MTLAAQAAAELATAVAAIAPGALETLARDIAAARQIVCHGVGREGLMMRALAMRLHHLGCDVAVAGDMTCPPLGPGDLLLAACGPGHLPTVGALMDVARNAGARVVCITAEPGGPTARIADACLTIPAQTMARDQTNPGLLPMGSVFEGAMFLAFELLVLDLRDRLGQTVNAMRARHTNLE